MPILSQGKQGHLIYSARILSGALSLLTQATIYPILLTSLNTFNKYGCNHLGCLISLMNALSTTKLSSSLILGSRECRCGKGISTVYGGVL